MAFHKLWSNYTSVFMVCVSFFVSIAEFPDVDVRGVGAGGVRERDGVLRGLKLAVSCLFLTEDLSIATSVLQEHGGILHRGGIFLWLKFTYF